MQPCVLMWARYGGTCCHVQFHMLDPTMMKHSDLNAGYLAKDE